MSDVFTARLQSARLLSAHVREMTFATAPFAFAPGQWVSVRLPVGDHSPLVRAYSLANTPQETQANGTFTLCFDRVEGGVGSGYLWDLPEGATVEWSGPVGNFTLPETTESNLLFAARYTGVVPFRSMLAHLEQTDFSGRVLLVYGVPNKTEAVYADELQALIHRVDWLTVEMVDGADENRGELVESEALLRSAPDFAPFTAFVCGVRAFTLPARNLLMERFDLTRKQVKVENYNGPTAR